jgi:hypothetical protein
MPTWSTPATFAMLDVIDKSRTVPRFRFKLSRHSFIAASRSLASV